MNPGQLDKRILLQRPTPVNDTHGDPQPSYYDVGSVWAKIEPLAGREYWQAQQVASKVSHMVTIRFEPFGRQLDTSWRFTYGDRTFSIFGHRNLMESDNLLELMAIEVT